MSLVRRGRFFTRYRTQARVHSVFVGGRRWHLRRISDDAKMRPSGENVTRRELREELRRFATKRDLRRFATKRDLRRFATKHDLQRFATKRDLRRFAADVRRYFEIVAESLRDDIRRLADGWAHHDVVMAEHELRITDLENQERRQL